MSFQHGCKGAGDFFYAHLNSDEYFIAHERREQDEEIAKLEKAKKWYQSQNESNSAAKVVLEELASKSKTPQDATVTQLKTLLKWMAPKVALSGKRRGDLLELYNQTPQPTEEANVTLWTDEEEEELKLHKLKRDTVTIESTVLGRKRETMANATAAIFHELSPEAQQKIELAIRESACKRAAADAAGAQEPEDNSETPN